MTHLHLRLPAMPFAAMLYKLLETSVKKFCRTSPSQGPSGKAGQYSWGKPGFHPYPDTRSSHQAEKEQDSLTAELRFTHRFPSGSVSVFIFWVIKTGCHTRSGREEGLKELVSASEVAAYQHILLTGNIAPILKNNNTCHFLQPFITGKIWAESDCQNPFQREYWHADVANVAEELIRAFLPTPYSQQCLSVSRHTPALGKHGLSSHCKAPASSQGTRSSTLGHCFPSNS